MKQLARLWIDAGGQRASVSEYKQSGLLWEGEGIRSDTRWEGDRIRCDTSKRKHYLPRVLVSRVQSSLGPRCFGKYIFLTNKEYLNRKETASSL